MSLSKRSRPIGVFDSGIGGLTVVRELLRQLPGERLVYFGDTARSPYGNKSPSSLIRFALETGRFMRAKGVKALVVACNSSSAYSLPALRQALRLPVVGVILAGARAAVRARRGGRIGVIGTKATVSSRAYQSAIRRLDPRAKVEAMACPLFVPLAEEGWMDHAVAREVARAYLGSFRRRKVDTVVLGCTHYPLLKRTIGAVLGPRIALVDSARETAAEVKALLEAEGLSSPRRRCAFASHEFYVSDQPRQFSQLGRRFLGRALRRVRMVHLRQLPA